MIKHKSQTHTRGFGGKLDNFESKEERALEKKHLRAYLKGWKYFRHGYQYGKLGQREPAWYITREVWTPKPQQ